MTKFLIFIALTLFISNGSFTLDNPDTKKKITSNGYVFPETVERQKHMRSEFFNYNNTLDDRKMKKYNDNKQSYEEYNKKNIASLNARIAHYELYDDLNDWEISHILPRLRSGITMQLLSSLPSWRAGMRPIKQCQNNITAFMNFHFTLINIKMHKIIF